MTYCMTSSPSRRWSQVLFARKTMPAKNLGELITWLKANPNKASAAVVTSGLHLLTAFFQKETGTQFTLVPYRGGAPAMQDLVSGQIDLFFRAADGLALMRAGSIKAYAVTSDTRLSLAPDVPTFAEMGLSALSHSVWFGFSRQRGRRRTLSASSMPRPWKHWCIRRCDFDSPNSVLRSFRASGKSRRCSAP